MRRHPLVALPFLFAGACSTGGVPSASAEPHAAQAVNRRATALTAEERAARRKNLTAEQFDVVAHEGTEPPFRNPYWNNHADGIYVDIVSGEPLFSSKEKFESGTGWPSFYAPLEKANVVTKSDRSFGAERTEVRSRLGESHLGHLFPDGPKPTGMRYCMDSASLRFVPADRLAAEGYPEYVKLFPDAKQQPAPADERAKK